MLGDTITYHCRISQRSFQTPLFLFSFLLKRLSAGSWMHINGMWQPVRSLVKRRKPNPLLKRRGKVIPIMLPLNWTSLMYVYLRCTPKTSKKYLCQIWAPVLYSRLLICLERTCISESRRFWATEKSNRRMTFIALKIAWLFGTIAFLVNWSSLDKIAIHSLVRIIRLDSAITR